MVGLVVLVPGWFCPVKSRQTASNRMVGFGLVVWFWVHIWHEHLARGFGGLEKPSVGGVCVAPATGFEPVTVRLTVGCSAVELRGKDMKLCALARPRKCVGHAGPLGTHVSVAIPVRLRPERSGQ